MKSLRSGVVTVESLRWELYSGGVTRPGGGTFLRSNGGKNARRNRAIFRQRRRKSTAQNPNGSKCNPHNIISTRTL